MSPIIPFQPENGSSGRHIISSMLQAKDYDGCEVCRLVFRKIGFTDKKAIYLGFIRKIFEWSLHTKVVLRIKKRFAQD